MLPIEDRFGLTPNLPTYTQARAFIRVMNGVSYQIYRQMYNKIKDQTGTPQDVMDWSDPDTWIPERLGGKSRPLP